MHALKAAELIDFVWCAEKMIAVMTTIGAAKIAACVTDSAVNMVAACNKCQANPAFSHILFLPCFMHAFSLLIGSILGHEHARQLVAQASKLVTYFRSSHRPLEFLTNSARQMGIKSSLQKPNATRFTSTFSLLNSVKLYEQPMTNLVQHDKQTPEAEKLLPKTATGEPITLHSSCPQAHPAGSSKVFTGSIYRGMLNLLTICRDCHLQDHCRQAILV